MHVFGIYRFDTIVLYTCLVTYTIMGVVLMLKSLDKRHHVSG